MAVEHPPQSLGVLDSTFNQFVFFDEGLKELIQKYNAEYAYWSKLKHIPLPKDFSALDFWSAIKMVRHNNYQAIEIPGEQFNYWITPRIQNMLHDLDRKSESILSGTSTLSDRQKKGYVLSTLMDEAISSSILEGAATTRRVAKEMLEKNRKPRSSSEKMVANNYQAMRYLQQHRNETIDLEKLFALHTIVTTETLKEEKDAGRFRTEEDEILIIDVTKEEVVYHPPAASRVSALIEWLLDFANEPASGAKTGSFIHPIVKASIIHFMVGYIHPFVDGNGRMARALFYWYLLAKGYRLAEFLSISSVINNRKAKYYNAFLYTEYDQNDLTYFIYFQIETLIVAFQNLEEYISLESRPQQDDILELLKQTGITRRQAELYLKIKKTGGIWQVTQAIAAMAVSHQTARNDLNALADKGLIDKIALDKKSQGWTVKSPSKIA